MTMIKTQLLLSYVLKIRLDEVYPNVFIALQIMLTCPNTVATTERSLSKLKLIKTFNRSHMTNSRLSSLAMLSIETSCVRSLDLEGVMQQWISIFMVCGCPPKTPNTCGPLLINRQDRQTVLVYFTWPTKRPGGHQIQLTMGQSLCLISCNSSDTQRTDATLEN